MTEGRLNLILALKAEADRKIGTMTERLNEAGPGGNAAVSSQLDYWRGKSDALAAALMVIIEVPG